MAIDNIPQDQATINRLIADEHTQANQQLERLRILTLALSTSNVHNALPECQQDELGTWLFDMVGQAQEHLELAIAYTKQKNSTTVLEAA